VLTPLVQVQDPLGIMTVSPLEAALIAAWTDEAEHVVPQSTAQVDL